MTKPLIGILGGMGPLATVDLMGKIVQETLAYRDQEHAPVIAWNVPQVADRQMAISGAGESPLAALLEGIGVLNAALATRIVIACNTAHYWFDSLSLASSAPIIHIADATRDALNASEFDGDAIGLLSTYGTLNARFYQERFEAEGLRVITNSIEEMDEFFVPGCYAVKAGELRRGGELLELATSALLRRGAQKVVLACTEVPVGLEHINSTHLSATLDANRALAKACAVYWHAARQSVHDTHDAHGNQGLAS